MGRKKNIFFDHKIKKKRRVCDERCTPSCDIFKEKRFDIYTQFFVVGKRKEDDDEDNQRFKKSSRAEL